MKGLWHVHTRCIKPGLGAVVWLWLVMPVLAIITLSSMLCVPSSWRITRLLHVGMVLLCLYFFLHCIDLAIQQAGTAVRYNYIMFQSLNTVWRTLSDIFILCGCWLTMKRHQTPKVTVGSFSLTMAGILWFLGLYKIGLQFALSFAWLDFIDLGSIESIAAARSGFDVAFAAVYFAVTLLIVVDSVPNSGEEFLAPREPLKHQDDERMQRCLKQFSCEAAMAGSAAYFLLIRAFCEAVIVGQLDWRPNNIPKIYRARDVCYSIFSVPLLFFIACSIPNKQEDDPDPWELETQITARLAEEKRVADEALRATLQTSLDAWPEEADRRFKEKLAAVTESGTKSAPAASVVIDALRDEVRSECSAEGSDERLLQGKLYHLASMEVEFEDWVSVYKWDGSYEKHVVEGASDDSGEGPHRLTMEEPVSD